jgi:hypothetical protein
MIIEILLFIMVIILLVDLFRPYKEKGKDITEAVGDVVDKLSPSKSKVLKYQPPQDETEVTAKSLQDNINKTL